MVPAIEIPKADITTLEVDAIVNAANSNLMDGGGVDGAIHRTGSPATLEECKKIVVVHGGCPTGEAVVTTAGPMPVQFVIHTVGPVWRSGNNDEAALLANCYTNSFQLADKNGCKTVALPNISTGIYGFPKKAASDIAVKTVKE